MTQTLLSRVQRDAVFVTGPDATSFLQSLLSQDLDPVPVGESTHALLLAPQGKLVVDMHAVHSSVEQWCCVCAGTDTVPNSCQGGDRISFPARGRGRVAGT
jgi:folate-binding Fe-S cluster repair protein YgfZ